MRMEVDLRLRVDSRNLYVSPRDRRTMEAVDLPRDQDSTALQDHRERRGRVARQGTILRRGAADARGVHSSRAVDKIRADSSCVLLDDITAHFHRLDNIPHASSCRCS